MTPPDNVTTTARLRAAGLTTHAIAARCRPSGPWQRVLPGVVLLSNRPPTRRQHVRSALLYAGPQAVLTGTDALRAHGLAPPVSERILLLVPATRRLAPPAPLTIERTTRLPVPVRTGGLPLAPVTRATTDAARHEPDPQRLQDLLVAPLRRGDCTAGDLHRELNAGNQRGSAVPRSLLSDLALTSTVHTTAQRLLQAAPLPPPLWRVPLHTRRGAPLGTADAWWPEAGLAWRLGNAQPHPLPVTEQARPVLTAAGITVLHTDPVRLDTAAETVIRELVHAFSYATTNPYPPDSGVSPCPC